jgi:serine/threonine protein kinase
LCFLLVQGVLPNGVDVAITKFDISDKYIQGLFENELDIIPKLQHANIIKLLGCCVEDKEGFLVYEYMPRSLYHNIIQGNLNYLQAILNCLFLSVVIIAELKSGVSLAWHLRFRIIEGFARGVVYLHQHSRLRLVHRDLKQILLDCDMNPRITGFGLAKVLKSNEDEVEVDAVGTW